MVQFAVNSSNGLCHISAMQWPKKLVLCQNVPLSMEITATPTIASHYGNWTLEFCPYTFILEVLLADTTNSLSNIVLMILVLFDTRK